MKTFSKSILAAAVLAASATTATVAQADGHSVDVSASVGVSNFYLWRGQDLGDGSAQVWGDLSASYGAFYGGVWAASGDDTAGNEYDLYAGYGGELLGFTYDVSVWNYNYPDNVGTTSATGFADLTDGIITIGYGPVSYTHIKTITSGDTAYQSYDLALGDYTLTYGDHKAAGTDDHINLAYSYNDNLAITLVFPIDAEDGGNSDAGDPLINFGLSLPIE